MPLKKIFVLLPDGVGLRNFAYSDFFDLGKKEDFEVVFWNNTPFLLNRLGFPEKILPKPKLHPLSDIYKNAIKHVELNLSVKKSGDKVYNGYRFPLKYNNFKAIFKNLAALALTTTNNTTKGLKRMRMRLYSFECGTTYYNQCLDSLKKEKPDMVFCTNQRPVVAIAPLLAAKALGIPTATFIFSWDNLPKATMVVETDYYFVWSDHMKEELIYYYPMISKENIFVTGTPQFEVHKNKDLLMPREAFLAQYNLDAAKKYICYSGDDVTTCPDDQHYLSDVATAVRILNKKGHDLEIIFRRCPVDFSSRFDKVLQDNHDIITSIAPLWEKIGEGWNTVLPLKGDGALQQNTIAHTEMVINLGSSMVFDYISYNKPCAFLNYDVAGRSDKSWSVNKIYKFIHFGSMPDPSAVLWINSASSITETIEKALNDPTSTISAAGKWFDIINKNPQEDASKRIWESIKSILR